MASWMKPGDEKVAEHTTTRLENEHAAGKLTCEISGTSNTALADQDQDFSDDGNGDGEVDIEANGEVEDQEAENTTSLLVGSAHPTGYEVKNVEISQTLLKINLAIILGTGSGKVTGYLKNHSEEICFLLIVLSALTGFLAFTASLRLRVAKKRASEVFGKIGLTATTVTFTTVLCMPLTTRYRWGLILFGSIVTLFHWLC